MLRSYYQPYGWRCAVYCTATPYQLVLGLSDQGSLVEVRHLSTSYGGITGLKLRVRLALWLAPAAASKWAQHPI